MALATSHFKHGQHLHKKREKNKEWKNTVSHSNTHFMLKKNHSAFSLLSRLQDCWLSCLQFKTYISLYAYFLHRKHNLLHLGFHLEWTQSKQSRSDDIKNKTKSWEHCILTEAPHCFRPYMRFHRSVVVPVPSQSTTQQWHCQHW